MYFGLALIVVLGLTSAAVAAKKPSPVKFGKARGYVVGSDPLHLATGDLDQDGKTDVVTSNFAASGGARSLSVLRGKRKGKLAPATTIPTPSQPDGLAIARLAGDHDPDLVVSGFSPPEIMIYRGGPGAGFAPPETIGMTASPRDIAVDDFTGDGIPDIVVKLQSPYGLAELIGLPNGHFGAPQTISAGVTPSMYLGSMHAADVNGDGLPDILLIRSDSVILTLLALKGGGFAAPIPRATPDVPLDVTAGDFDGNGKVDLAVAGGVGGAFAARGTSISEDRIDIFRGKGNGKFVPSYSHSVGSSPGIMGSIAATDFDRDGRDDVVAGFQTAPQVAVMRGRKKARVTGPTFIKVKADSLAVTTAALNKDKRPDILASGIPKAGGGKLSTLLQKKPHKHHKHKHKHKHH